MVEPISLTLALSALIASLFTHIKFSKCCGFEIQTRSIPSTPTPTSPLLQLERKTNI